MTQIAPPPYAQYPAQPPQKPRGPRGLLIALIAVGVALIIAITVGITVMLTRTTAAPAQDTAAPAAGQTAAASADPVGETPADLKLRGPLTSPYTVCTMVAATGKRVPRFALPVVYESNTVARATEGREQLVLLANQVSPATAAPVGPAVQRWVTTSAAYLVGVRDRATAERLAQIDAVSMQVVQEVNTACKSVGVG